MNTRIKYNKFYIPNHFYEMQELLLTRLVYQGKIKEVYKYKITQLYKSMNKSFLLNDKYDVFENISTNKWNLIEKKVNTIRIKIIGENFTRPIQLVGFIFSFLKRSLSRILKPPGLFIAFYGVDGCGKSTQIENITKDLRGIFSDKFRQFHFRPGLKYSLPNKTTFSHPHNQNEATLIRSVAKLFFYLLIYNWGYITQVLTLLARNGLVIFYRYYFRPIN